MVSAGVKSLDLARPFRRAAFVVLILFALVTGGLADAHGDTLMAGDVLLTFDTEFEDDAAAVEALALDVPATYFWTGSYAQRHPDLLRRLSDEGNTIGSHSFHHDDLTTLAPRQVQLDLELAQIVIEGIAGVPVRAFRAPFLEYNDTVTAEIERLGFDYDSSDKSPWPRNDRQKEVAISEFENLLASDYDIFEGRGLDDATALDFLIRAYGEHAQAGRPFVLLMHPRIIGRHADVLHGFIAYVRQNGGRFRTLDGYLDSLSEPRGPRQAAVWVDVQSAGQAEPLMETALAHGATDVFLDLEKLRGAFGAGPTWVAALVEGLQSRGMRVHLAVPINDNPALLSAVPGAALMDQAGTRSLRWVSPAHPEVRLRLAEDTAALVRELNVDGLHLFDLGYPGMGWGFSPAALLRFSAQTGISENRPEELLSRFYGIWMQWRSADVAALVGEINQASRAVRPDLVTSLSLVAEVATNYRLQEALGWNLRLLGEQVDKIVVWTGDASVLGRAALGRELLAARTQAGTPTLLLGIRQETGPQFAAGSTGYALPDVLETLALTQGNLTNLSITDPAVLFSWSQPRALDPAR